MAAVQQTAGEELAEQPWIARECREQDERWHAGRHDAIERGLDCRWVRRCGGSDAACTALPFGAQRILWELRGAPLTFRALQDAAQTNPSVLNTRLRELRQVALVEHDTGGYRLSDSGRSLLRAMQPLYDWAQRWKV